MTMRRMRASALLLAVAIVSAGAVGPAHRSATAASPGSEAFSATKTVTREFTNGGAVDEVDSRNVKVDVDHTQNLRGRERLRIKWSGARPSAGRAADPYGENGLNQEYPVVILQCRGLDNPALKVSEQVSPRTCWTSTRQQRSQSTSKRLGVWRHDLYARDDDKAQKSGMDPFPNAAACSDIGFFSTHLTPFTAANGKTYPACNSETMPPEAAVGGAFPPAEVAAFTDLDGKGSVNFEVRSATENESLGCTNKVACSIVVIPIMGLSCADGDTECRKTGRMRPGSSNYAGEGVESAVSPLYWWSESNWRNRISVPLTFGLAPDVCDVLDKRKPTAFYGSELMSQAALQWSPAYCLRKDRFKFQHNRLPDEAAFALMEKGEAAASFVSGNRERETTDPVGYAPTAVTGFEVAFIVDRPDNAGEETELRLTPRLLAKLLTQSYPGSALGRQHPGLESNPLSINLDPEFQALNPGLDTYAREAAATVLSLSESSDVIRTLTEYIAQDPEAKSFLAGTKDPWGMVINPTYKDLSLPLSEWPLLDTFVPEATLECQKQNPAPYFTQLAAPLNSLRKIAEAVLDAWPNVQTKCDRASSSDPFKVGRIDRQGIGGRFMLGVVSLGDAERFGLRSALLQTKSAVALGTKFTGTQSRTFTGPTAAAITSAVGVAKPTKPSQAFVIAQKDLKAKPAAYPGTMIVYTAARLSGLGGGESAKVAKFIRIATSEGQKSGSGNGQLPDGYVPITKEGATAKLYAAAQKVATQIAAQQGIGGERTGNGAQAAVTGGSSNADVVAEPADLPSTGSSKVSSGQSETMLTAAHDSGTAGLMLPLLVVLAVLAGVAGPVTRVMAYRKGRR